MKRDAGWTTVVLAMVTAVGVGSVGTRISHQAAGAAKTAMAEAGISATPLKQGLYKGPCEDIKSLLTVVLGVTEERLPAPQSCAAVLPEKPVREAADTGGRAREQSAQVISSTATPSQPALGNPGTMEQDEDAESNTDDASDNAGTHKPKLRFVIATLPDPLHTHLPLVFDHQTEAIQQAAQDSEYTYDSSWMPWETEDAQYPLVQDSDIAEDRKSRREDQPGVLLFRRSLARLDAAAGKTDGGPSQVGYDDVLIVFVVGEEPTAGIHREQFRNATAWIRSLRGIREEKHPVEILSPSFSGSLPSLVQLLEDPDVHRALRPGAGQKLEIRSGQATSNNAVEWFLKQATTDPLANLNIHFLSVQQDDERMLRRYYKYLDDIGLGTCHLAIVSEDETAYGFSLELPTQPEHLKTKKKRWGSPPFGPHIPPNCETDSLTSREPPSFYYPRDISALRAAYQEQAVFNGASEASEGVGDTPRHTLQTDLADPEGKEHDTIRSYAGAQTALSEEAALLQIVSMLRAHQSQFILLRSSNPLDQLFLAHFFKMTYPEARVIVTGNDLLLRRDVGRSGLNGTMTLSTYPLLPQIDDWTTWGLVKHSHRAFKQDGAMGVYTAMRFLLSSPGRNDSCTNLEDEPSGFLPINHQSGLHLPDYANPFWMDQPACRPVTWLTVLGNNGFWPIAALDWIPPPARIPERKPPTVLEQLQGTAVAVVREILTAPGKVARSAWTETRGFFSPFDLYGLRAMEDAARRAPADMGTAEALPGGKLPYVPLSMNMALLAVMAWTCFHVFCCCSPSITVKPDHRSYFVRLKKGILHADPRRTWRRGFWRISRRAPRMKGHGGRVKALLQPLSLHQRTHVTLIVSSSALLVMISTTLGWGYGWLSDKGAPIFRPWLYEVIPVLMWWLGAAAVLGNSFIEHQMNVPDGARVSLRSLFSPPRRWMMRLRSSAWRAMRRPFGWYVLLTASFYCLMILVLDSDMHPEWKNLTYLRAMNLTTGVSPVLPIILLLLGMYGWCWYALRGLALFDSDRPLLPMEKDLAVKSGTSGQMTERQLLTMLGAEHASHPLEDLCWPFHRRTWGMAALLFLAICMTSYLITQEAPLRSLGTQRYSRLVCIWIAISMSALLANLWQLMHLWLRLKSLLVFLDKLPLRRTLQSMRGFTWGSIWKIGGNVMDLRYKLFYRQFETLNHLQAAFQEFDLKQCRPVQPPLDAQAWADKLQASRKERIAFSLWYAKNWDKWAARDLSALQHVQLGTAEMGGQLLSRVLIPAWREETKSLLVLAPEKGEELEDEGPAVLRRVENLERHVKHAEELVCLLYLGFVQNILGRMRAMVLGMVSLFLSIALVLPSYPFDPRPVLTGAVIFLFVTVGAVIFIVYAQMFRDTTLSHLTNTKPGELGVEFWLKLLSFGVGPVLGLLATVFPQLSDSVLSWLLPSLSSVK